MEGREGRDGFGASTGRKKQKQGGTSNKEKSKRKNLPVAARLQAVSATCRCPRRGPVISLDFLTNHDHDHIHNHDHDHMTMTITLIIIIIVTWRSLIHGVPPFLKFCRFGGVQG